MLRDELQRLVGGGIADFNLQKVAFSAQRLFSLQQTAPGNVSSPVRVMDGYQDNVGEFGADLPFKAPSRFLVEPIENGLSLPDGSYAASTSHGEHYDGNMVSVYHHTTNNRGTVNLRWLKDACDMIVKGGGSLLSGDELAMALSRVLLSNKAGDEVFMYLFFENFFLLLLVANPVRVCLILITSQNSHYEDSC